MQPRNCKIPREIFQWRSIVLAFINAGDPTERRRLCSITLVGELSFNLFFPALNPKWTFGSKGSRIFQFISFRLTAAGFEPSSFSW
uniref:Uncharacterized protein n=1 Tax=Utricularia reniformis TaxID=192314 RepID=A0A1Y0B395_9LAMI|nr:hypothetical protein AEK19_MT1682 [Utricularia reniformis]ART31864.1 hypothetical protein AEK19_MT1682 [Utricularia reniformis]